MTKNKNYRIICGNAFRELNRLQPNSIDCVFTSPNPPFYSKEGLGSEETEDEYIFAMTIFAAKIKRVLKDSGTFFLHLADYHDQNGSLRMTPQKIALLMKENNWFLRSDLIWHRPNEPIQGDKTRFKRDAEHIFFFTKTLDYWFNPIYRGTSVWSYEYKPPEHGEFESGFPTGIIATAINSACPLNGTVLDPFCGTGTTGEVALRYGCNFIGIEIKPELIPKIKKRLDESNDTS